MNGRAAAFAVVVSLLVSAPLAAQRAEIVVLAGTVVSPGEEFDRVTSSQLSPPTYTRERGRRESGSAFGVAATFAIRGHLFGEIGLLHHGVERNISSTGAGDPTGPFVVTTTTDGSISSVWIGPSYRMVDRERLAISALVAPALFVMRGDAYSSNAVDFNAPLRSTEFGLLMGIRARYWATDRIGVHVSVEDALWALRLSPHPGDSPFRPENYTRTPPRHEFRLQLGAAFKLR